MIVGHVESVERGEISEDIGPDVIDDVVADVEILEFGCPNLDPLSQDRHLVEGQIYVLQCVGNPPALRKHLLGDKPNVVVTQIDLPETQTILKKTICFVLQFLQPEIQYNLILTSTKCWPVVQQKLITRN